MAAISGWTEHRTIKSNQRTSQGKVCFASSCPKAWEANFSGVWRRLSQGFERLSLPRTYLKLQWPCARQVFRSNPRRDNLHAQRTALASTLNHPSRTVLDTDTA
eukprot:3559838-Amphidinium_carterae.1